MKGTALFLTFMDWAEPCNRLHEVQAKSPEGDDQRWLELLEVSVGSCDALSLQHFHKFRAK